MGVSEVDQDKLHTFSRHMRRCAVSRLLAPQDLQGDGIKSTGAYPFPPCSPIVINSEYSEAIYKFFMSLKQRDGSFHVAHHSEVDVRGIYCLLTVATLLDLMTPELVAGTAEFIASCQTYEGGFSNASFPSYDPENPDKLLDGSPRPALGEAHGGYTFCAVASWVMLQPYIEQMDKDKRPTINIKALTRWLVQMQGGESELGGFKGRTNKLVDGCYAWWVGGTFALLEALGVGGLQNDKAATEEVIDEEEEILKSVNDWVDVDGAWNTPCQLDHANL